MQKLSQQSFHKMFVGSAISHVITQTPNFVFHAHWPLDITGPLCKSDGGRSICWVQGCINGARSTSPQDLIFPLWWTWAYDIRCSVIYSPFTLSGFSHMLKIDSTRHWQTRMYQPAKKKTHACVAMYLLLSCFGPATILFHFALFFLGRVVSLTPRGAYALPCKGKMDQSKGFYGYIIITTPSLGQFVLGMQSLLHDVILSHFSLQRNRCFSLQWNKQ